MLRGNKCNSCNLFMYTQVTLQYVWIKLEVCITVWCHYTHQTTELISIKHQTRFRQRSCHQTEGTTDKLWQDLLNHLLSRLYRTLTTWKPTEGSTPWAPGALRRRLRRSGYAVPADRVLPQGIASRHPRGRRLAAWMEFPALPDTRHS